MAWVTSDIWVYILSDLGHLNVHYMAKRSFYRAANAVFCKIGRSASEEMIKIIHSKCVPVRQGMPKLIKLS